MLAITGFAENDGIFRSGKASMADILFNIAPTSPSGDSVKILKHARFATSSVVVAKNI